MIQQGGEPTAGASSTACDGQWRFAEQRMKEIGPNRCDGLHYVHQPLRLVLGHMARDGELQV